MSEQRPEIEDEDRLARIFEQRRGDVSRWGEEKTLARTRGGATTTVFSIRVTPDELETLRSAADEFGKTVSDFVRTAALDYATRRSRASAQTIDVVAQSPHGSNVLIEVKRRTTVDLRATASGVPENDETFVRMSGVAEEQTAV